MILNEEYSSQNNSCEESPSFPSLISSSTVISFQANTHGRTGTRHFPQSTMLLHEIVSECWVESQHRKRVRNGRGQMNLLLLYSLSGRDPVHSIIQALVVCYALCMAPHVGPCLGPTNQHHAKTERKSGALRRLCFSCLSTASSSEAMFLLKPLKELRAKRKGTHLCLCVRILE